MFQGTTIDELIQTVERAEQQTRHEEQQGIKVPDFPIFQRAWQEWTEVA